MRLDWDLRELKEFANNLGDTHDLETSLMTATKEISKALHRILLNLTPVDTGNLRKMWSAGDNLRFTVQKVTGGYEVTLINTATNKRYLTDKYPNGFMYGLAVNDGHKTPSGGWVMGKFFVENSMNQLKSTTQIESIVMKELQKWWKGV